MERGKSYEEKHRAIKQQTKTIRKLVTKHEGWFFEKEVKIDKPMQNLSI